jgi:hypothetical protein
MIILYVKSIQFMQAQPGGGKVQLTHGANASTFNYEYEQTSNSLSCNIAYNTIYATI